MSVRVCVRVCVCMSLIVFVLFFIVFVDVILFCNFLFLFPRFCCFIRDILLNTLLTEEERFSGLSMILVNL